MGEAVEVRRALRMLPERQRAAVVLWYIVELTVAETAVRQMLTTAGSPR